MSEQQINPARLFVARVFYWTIWGPACLVAAPFFLLSNFVDWLAFKVFPKVGDWAQPLWGVTHAGTLWVANRIAGIKR